MGNPNGLSHAAAARLADLAPEIRSIQAASIDTLSAIAATLNDRAIPAARGGTWSATQVGRVMARLG